MNDIHAGPSHSELFDIASSQSGYFTASQARGCGFSYALLSHHAGAGKFVRVRRGLYRLREYPSSAHEDVTAAWLALGSDAAVVSHESALELLDLSDAVPNGIHLTVPRSHRGRKHPRGVRIHTTVDPPGGDEVMVREGMRVTAPVRSIADAARAGMSPEHAIAAVHQALERGLATRDQFLARAQAEGGRVARLIRQALAGETGG